MGFINYLLNWQAASLLLNLVWFVYAMVNQRWLRKRVHSMEFTLLDYISISSENATSLKDHVGLHFRDLRGVMFDIQPAIAAALLEKHFRKRRNEDGVMLMKSATVLLQEKKPRRVSPKPSP